MVLIGGRVVIALHLPSAVSLSARFTALVLLVSALIGRSVALGERSPS